MWRRSSTNPRSKRGPPPLEAPNNNPPALPPNAGGGCCIGECAQSRKTVIRTTVSRPQTADAEAAFAHQRGRSATRNQPSSLPDPLVGIPRRTPCRRSHCKPLCRRRPTATGPRLTRVRTHAKVPLTLLGLGNSSPQAAMTSSPEHRELLRHAVLENIKVELPLVVALTAA